jgi:hypothetical protein
VRASCTCTLAPVHECWCVWWAGGKPAASDPRLLFTVSVHLTPTSASARTLHLLLWLSAVCVCDGRCYLILCMHYWCLCFSLEGVPGVRLQLHTACPVYGFLFLREGFKSGPSALPLTRGRVWSLQCPRTTVGGRCPRPPPPTSSRNPTPWTCCDVYPHTIILWENPQHLLLRCVWQPSATSVR